MYRNLFIAWYCLGILALCFTAYLVALPFIGASRALGSFGFLGLLGFIPAFRHAVFRGEKQDERDVSFLQRSVAFGAISGIGASGVVTAVLAVVYRFLHGLDSVPLNVFGLPLTCGAAVGVLAFSVLLLLFYYKGEHADKENNLEL